MSEIKTPPVKATLVDSIADSRHIPGAFRYFTSAGTVAGFNFICPCGCGRLSPVHFKRDLPEDPCWQWNGDRERPTLTPSIHWRGHWHGWLKNGVFESC